MPLTPDIRSSAAERHADCRHQLPCRRTSRSLPAFTPLPEHPADPGIHSPSAGHPAYPLHPLPFRRASRSLPASAPVRPNFSRLLAPKPFRGASRSLPTSAPLPPNLPRPPIALDSGRLQPGSAKIVPFAGQRAELDSRAQPPSRRLSRQDRCPQQPGRCRGPRRADAAGPAGRIRIPGALQQAAAFRPAVAPPASRPKTIQQRGSARPCRNPLCICGHRTNLPQTLPLIALSIRTFPAWQQAIPLWLVLQQAISPTNSRQAVRPQPPRDKTQAQAPANSQQVAPCGSAEATPTARRRVSRYRCHGGGPALGALNDAVSASPAAVAGQPPER